MKKIFTRHRLKFTLIELLVVIVIIGMLMALLLPALSKAKYRAKVVVCMNNLKEIATGVQSYAGDYDMYYPSVGDWPRNGYLIIGRMNSWSFDRATIDLLDPEFGGDCRTTVFTCPLAVRKPTGFTKSVSPAWNYSLWPDVTARGGIRSESTAYGHDRDRRLMMMRVGDAFNIDLEGNGRKNCHILASDRVQKGLNHRDKFGVGRTVGTNHFSPGFTRYAGTGNDWNMLNWGVRGAEGNYALDDGSVFVGRLDKPTNLTGAKFDGFYTDRGYYENSFLPYDGFEN